MFDFSIIGAQKCGTTSLFNILRCSNTILLPEVKEAPYYCNNALFGQEDRWRYYFGDIDKRRRNNSQAKVGFAYVNICYYPELSLQRILRESPKIKIIMLIRDRVERAVSAYEYAIARGWESEKGVEKAFSLGRKESFTRYHELSNLTYIEHSLYGEQVEKILQQISPENFLLIDLASMRDNPDKTIMRVGDFLAVDFSATNFDFRRKNEAHDPYFRGVQRLIMSDNPIKRAYQKFVPRSFRYFFNKKLIRRVEELNMSKKREFGDRKVLAIDHVNRAFGKLLAADESKLVDVCKENKVNQI